MNNTIKGAIVIAVAIIIAFAMQSYFSPYQSCVRGARLLASPSSEAAKPGYAEMYCAKPGFR